MMRSRLETQLEAAEKVIGTLASPETASSLLWASLLLLSLLYPQIVVPMFC